MMMKIIIIIIIIIMHKFYSVTPVTNSLFSVPFCHNCILRHLQVLDSSSSSLFSLLSHYISDLHLLFLPSGDQTSVRLVPVVVGIVVMNFRFPK